MDDNRVQALVESCLRYIQASKLPSPLPGNPLEYSEWREQASSERVIDEDAEDAWSELYRLVDTEPSLGWRVLVELAARCDDEDSCAPIAAGPLTTFLRAHADSFHNELEEELMKNAGFRRAYYWLQ